MLMLNIGETAQPIFLSARKRSEYRLGAGDHLLEPKTRNTVSAIWVFSAACY